MISDEKEYFHLRCLMEDEDYKTGYNGWLQVYHRLQSRYQTQLDLTNMGLFELDYYEQEHPHLKEDVVNKKIRGDRTWGVV